MAAKSNPRTLRSLQEEPQTQQPSRYNTKWTTCGRKLLKDGKSFFVRGVNYAPTPIGLPGRLDLLNDTRIFARDLKNLRDMHANAVKVSSIDRFSRVPLWRNLCVLVLLA